MKKHFLKAISILCSIAMIISAFAVLSLNCVSASGAVSSDFTYWFEPEGANAGNELVNANYFVYDANENSFTRNSASTGWETFNVAWLVSEKQYTNFVLDFDMYLETLEKAQNWIWIEFGKRTVGQTTKADIENDGSVVLIAGNHENYYYVKDYISGVDKHNLSGQGSYFTFDSSVWHHVQVVVSGGKYSMYVDGFKFFDNCNLPANYQGGHFALGSGLGGKVANINTTVLDKNSVKSLEPEDCSFYFEENGFYAGTALKEDNSKYDYTSLNNTFRRITTGGWQDWNVAWLFAKQKYENFALSFDFKLCPPEGLIPWIWIEFGKQSIDQTTSAGKEDGAVVTSVLSDNYRYTTYEKTRDWWGTQFDSLDLGVTHHAQLIVDEGYYNLMVDGLSLCFFALPENYKSGYIGLGTGCGEISFSNIKIADKSVSSLIEGYSSYSTSTVDSYYLSGKLSESNASDYWRYAGNNMISRKANGGTAALYTNEKYINFEMTFDYISTTPNFYVGVGAAEKGAGWVSYGSLTNPASYIARIHEVGCLGFAPTAEGKDYWFDNISGSSLFSTRAAIGKVHNLKLVSSNGKLTAYVDGLCQGTIDMPNYDLNNGGYIYIGAVDSTFSCTLPTITRLPDPEKKYEPTDAQKSAFTSFSTVTRGNQYTPVEFTQDSSLADNWYCDKDGMLHKANSSKLSALYLDGKYSQNIRMTFNYKTSTEAGDWGAFVGFGSSTKGADWYVDSESPAVNTLRFHYTSAVGFAPQSKDGGDFWILREIDPSYEQKDIHTAVIELKYDTVYVYIDGIYRGTHSLVNYEEGYISLAAYNDDIAYSIPTVEAIDPITNASGNVDLSGKKALFVGDSISAGTGDSAAWANRLGSYYNMTVKNNSQGGWVVADDSQTGLGSIQSQLNSEIGTDYDYIVIEGGINDLMRNVNQNSNFCKLGEISNSYNLSAFDTTTFAGGLEAIFYNATTGFENSSVGYIFTYKPQTNWIGNWEVAQQYVATAKAICEKWNISYIDLWNDEAVNSVLSDNATYRADGLHVNEAGYEVIMPEIAAWFETLTKTEYAGYGHINDDGVINLIDLVAAKKLLAKDEIEYLPSGDVNKDKSFSAGDLTVLRAYLLGSITHF